METSNKTLANAITQAVKIFATTADKITRVNEQSAVQRASAVNFAVDVARVEGLKPAQIVRVIGAEIFDVCATTGIIGESTASAYKSGLKRAVHWGKAWHARAHFNPEDGGLEPVPTADRDNKSGRKVKPERRAVTKGTIKVDKKTRTLTVQLAKSAPLDDFTQAIKVIQSEPGRIAMLLAWVKAHDWK